MKPDIHGSKRQREQTGRALDVREKLRSYKVIELLVLGGIFALIAMIIIFATQLALTVAP